MYQTNTFIIETWKVYSVIFKHIIHQTIVIFKAIATFVVTKKTYTKIPDPLLNWQYGQYLFISFMLHPEHPQSQT